MVVRYSSSFGAQWLAIILGNDYEQELKTRSFGAALQANISYYDEKGSDEILNAIITQTRYAGRVINNIVNFMQMLLLTLMYALVALFMAPLLTIVGAVLLGGISYVVQNVLEPGYTVGERVAEANEQVQEKTQSGTKGIRDIKIFGISDDIYSDFLDSVEVYTNSSIEVERNQQAISNFYNLLTALMLFLLLYISISILSLSISTLGVFLFAMFRLAPRISNMNSTFYSINTDLPHLVRTQNFVRDLRRSQEDRNASGSISKPISQISFNKVSFSYTEEEQILDQVSFSVNQGEFVGFVGQSGAGKSTIVSLLARMYEPDSGEILANGVSISQLDIQDWRTKIAMVRQNPFIFNETLRYNITMGNSTTDSELQQVAEIAKITEFISDLPEGFNTTLGDDGIKLSGGQRQRVALARALFDDDAEILILDEATSDLDSNLEKKIHSELVNLDEKWTVFVIAHRLSTVQDADRIYTIEEGKITETGTHRELIESNGKYAELYKIQS
jgi:subfamily B ATP-binding cassette protein MsbA